MATAVKLNPDNTIAEEFDPYQDIKSDSGVTHPKQIFDRWTDAELNEIGYARLEVQEFPTGKQSTATSDELVDGVMVRSHTLEDIPYHHAPLRAAEYPPIDALIVAMWEQIVEDRPDAAAALEVERQAIKTKYPK